MMPGQRHGEIVLGLLEYIYATPHDWSPGRGLSVPPDDWEVEGRRVEKPERVRAIQSAADDGYIEVTLAGRAPYPVAMTAKGRKFVEEWGHTGNE